MQVRAGPCTMGCNGTPSSLVVMASGAVALALKAPGLLTLWQSSVARLAAAFRLPHAYAKTLILALLKQAGRDKTCV